MTVAPSVVAVVVHYGEAGPAHSAIDALACSSSVLLEWVFVDNNPSSSAALRRLVEGAGGRYLSRPDNPGFAGGANAGMRMASGLWEAAMVVLLNSDVEVFVDCLERLEGVLSDAPRIGVVGPGLLFHEPPRRWWNCGSRLRWPRAKPASLRHGEPYRDVDETPREVDYICGAAMAFRPDLLRRIGELPEDYFLYFEDADFCERARRAGSGVVVVPAALASHRGGASFRGCESTATYYQVRNRLLYSKRWSPAAGAGRRQRRLFLCQNVWRALTALLRGDWPEGRARLIALVHYLSGRVGKAKRGIS